jgi:hypothetical protein
MYLVERVFIMIVRRVRRVGRLPRILISHSLRLRLVSNLII